MNSAYNRLVAGLIITCISITHIYSMDIFTATDAGNCARVQELIAQATQQAVELDAKVKIGNPEVQNDDLLTQFFRPPHAALGEAIIEHLPLQACSALSQVSRQLYTALAPEITRKKAIFALVNQIDDEGSHSTPLCWASRFGHDALARILIAAGAHIHHVNAAGLTPLHYAALYRNIPVVHTLLAAGAHINGQWPEGTPLHCACTTDNPTVVSILIGAGADVHKKDVDGYTPLHCAASHGRKLIIPLLIAAGANINEKNTDEDTPLHLAITHGHQSTVDTLLTLGADPNTLNKRDETPLYTAALHQQVKIGHSLIAHGATLNDSPGNNLKKLYFNRALYNALIEQMQQVATSMQTASIGWHPETGDDSSLSLMDQALTGWILTLVKNPSSRL